MTKALALAVAVSLAVAGCGGTSKRDTAAYATVTRATEALHLTDFGTAVAGYTYGSTRFDSDPPSLLTVVQADAPAGHLLDEVRGRLEADGYTVVGRCAAEAPCLFDRRVGTPLQADVLTLGPGGSWGFGNHERGAVPAGRSAAEVIVSLMR